MAPQRFWASSIFAPARERTLAHILTAMTTQLKPARGHGKRASERAVLTRCLLLLNRLKQGAADKAALIDAVQRDLPEAYPASPAAQRQAFKRDLQRLRRIFGVALTYANGQYALSEPGPLFSLSLSPEALEGMMGLALAFEGQPDYANVLRFIEREFGLTGQGS